MFDDNKLNYHIFKDYNIDFDEKGNTIGTVRLVQWVKNGNEPDESKAKVEIRKISNKDGQEITLKGFSFSTPEGPGELVTGMIKAGFGDTKDILRSVRTREDFLEAAKTINEDNDNEEGTEMFDMRDLMLGMSVNDEEIEE